METIVRCTLLSFMLGISCKAFFEIFAPARKYRHKWMEYMIVLMVTAGFLVIAFTEIPAYFLQPVRFIIVIALSVQICFQIKVVKNVILSVLFCGIYWILAMIFLSIVYVLPMVYTKRLYDWIEIIIESSFLCLMLFLRSKLKKRIYIAGRERKWVGFSLFPIFGLIVLIAIGMMPSDGSSVDRYAKLAAILGFTVICLCLFFYIENMLEKEEEVQSLRLIQARTHNQMELYRTMQKNYEQNRKLMHDYKNQLNCIQGMLLDGKTKEASAYISKLTGSIRKNADYVNTNHTVVNVVLNQKYQEACEKGITMTMAVNDLSGIAVSEEEIVVLLVNLLDNAVEACERLTCDKIIRFKMMLEDGQLVISIRNPVKEPVKIKGKRISTVKNETAHHGIGLMNVDSVIRKNGGTSVLRCEDGWFYFSAIIGENGGIENSN
ncbi:MAG: GHKL domain-containing protein, partial [Lachnospiraceae bacterium]|nr:GHKL domain-containing protein [Lachnospiraceae bacterium]